MEKTESPAKKEVKPAKTKAKAKKPAAKAVAQKVHPGYDPWKVIKHVHMAEKSMNMVERENKLAFIVSMDAEKNDVKKAVERAFQVKVDSVNIENTQKGEKKAYVRLSPEFRAIDIATKLGMI